MYTWIQECPDCGYISGVVSNPTSVTKEWLQSESYLTCDGISFTSELAKSFYRYYMISKEDQNTEDAFFAVLHAAWACDDAYDHENAKRCRKLAVPLAAQMIADDHENKQTLMLIKADVMRRAEAFDEVIEEFSQVHFGEELLDRIMEFQINKAKEKDEDCYRIEDVTG